MFLRSISLPSYLEETLHPFVWSGIFSTEFRDSITSAILANNREDAIPQLTASIRTIKFLDKDYVEQLCDALERFAKEGFPK